VTSTISGTLNGVTINGNMVVEEGAELNVQNNLNLQNATVTIGTYVNQPSSESNTAIFLSGNGSITGTGTINFETSFTGDTVAAGDNTSLTIGPGITIQSDTAGGGIGNNSPTTQLITNQGTISSHTAGQTINIYGNDFINDGTISASNGGILRILGLTNDGTILVNGQKLIFGTSTTNAGTITIDSGASVTQGTFAQSSAGTLDYVLSAPGSGNPLFTILSGGGTLSGDLSIQFATGYVPTMGSQWILMQGTSITSQFASYNLPSIPGDAFSIQYSANSVTLTVVPEPGPYALILAASTALLLHRRKRNSTHPSRVASTGV
jgi:hypothetical protein